MDLGAPSAEVDGEEGQDAKTSDVGTRAVQLGSRVFYTADEVRSFRTLGLEPGGVARLLQRGTVSLIQCGRVLRDQAPRVQGPQRACLRGQRQALGIRVSR